MSTYVIILVALMSSQAAGYTVEVSKAECQTGKLSLSSVADAAAKLSTFGVVALQPAPGARLVSPRFISAASDQAKSYLTSTLERVRSAGIDPEADSFAFAEIVHRSRKRYDLAIDLRRTPPDAPWDTLSTAVERWTTPVISAAGQHGSLERAVDGLLTSLPGAEAQRFHTDGSLPGSYNCLMPLVDVGAQGTGTEFWLASHCNDAVPDLAAQGRLAVLDCADLPMTPSEEVVRPGLNAGDLLIYDYRVVHRGPANSCPHDRPIFYSVWADPSSAGDGANFPRRSLREIEQRRELLGPSFDIAMQLRGGMHAVDAAGTAGTPPTKRCAAVNYAVGDVVELQHAFPALLHFEASAAPPAQLRGFFRGLPTSLDGASVYIGEAPLSPSDSPNCYLAPSIDGDLTRRLVAIAPIAMGERFFVPFAFVDDLWSAKIEYALDLAAEVNAPAPREDLGYASEVREADEGRGRGVFAGRDYAEGELVATWRCRAVPDADVPPGMLDYCYTAPILGQSLILFGQGMLYNDGAGRANLAWSVPTDANLMLTDDGHVQFFARRPIEKGDELLANYGEDYWEARGIRPW